jgi:hypothetical protein
MKLSQTTIIVIGILLLVAALSLMSYLSYSRELPMGYSLHDQTYSPVEFYDNDYSGFYIDAGPKVTLFSLENFQGESKSFSTSVPSLVKSDFLNTKSFVLGPFTKVVYFENENFTGRFKEFENKQDLDIKFDRIMLDNAGVCFNIASMQIKLVTPYIIAYNGENLGGGKSKIFHTSQPNLTGDWAPVGNKSSIMSFKLSPYTNVIMYSEPGYKGERKEFVNQSGQESKVVYMGGTIQIKSFEIVKTSV